MRTKMDRGPCPHHRATSTTGRKSEKRKFEIRGSFASLAFKSSLLLLLVLRQREWWAGHDANISFRAFSYLPLKCRDQFAVCIPLERIIDRPQRKRMSLFRVLCGSSRDTFCPRDHPHQRVVFASCLLDVTRNRFIQSSFSSCDDAKKCLSYNFSSFESYKSKFSFQDHFFSEFS